MDHSRYHFLAHTALPANKNGHIHRRDLQDLLADPYHLRTGRQEAQILGHLVAVIAQRLILRGELLLLPGLQHGRVQLRFLERFGQIVVRPNSNGFNDCAYLVRARKHDHVEAAVHLHQLLQRIEAVYLRHQHVQDDEVGTLPLVHSLERSFPELTVSTSNPSTSNSVCRYFRMLGSSSTTRTFSFTAIDFSLSITRICVLQP